MDDLVRRRDLLDVLAYSSDSWAGGVQGIRAWWPHAVKIKDNIVREIEKLEAVPEASVDKLTELLVADGHRVNARALAKYILDNSALFATNHLPLEMKSRQECPSLDYSKGWNDAVKQMASSHMQAMPCLVGDVVYGFCYEGDDVKVVPEQVEEISFTKNGVEIGTDKWCYSLSEIGKNLFFTEEEAMVALEAHVKKVDALIADAKYACKEVWNVEQKATPSKTSHEDPTVWGEVDADEYDFY